MLNYVILAYFNIQYFLRTKLYSVTIKSHNDQSMIHYSYMLNSDSFIIIQSSFGSLYDAQKCAKALIQEKLGFCAHILPGIQSYYQWKESLHCDEEYLLQLKSIPQNWSACIERITLLHPYELPEIIQLPITAIESRYQDWALKHLS